jgi:hypothetical protein
MCHVKLENFIDLESGLHLFTIPKIHKGNKERLVLITEVEVR